MKPNIRAIRDRRLKEANEKAEEAKSHAKAHDKGLGKGHEKHHDDSPPPPVSAVPTKQKKTRRDFDGDSSL